EGSGMTFTVELAGQEFVALNGGPEVKFSPAISFVVNCKMQKELDVFWDKLSAGGQPRQCGWLTDKFGVTWQIVPTILTELLQDKNPKKSENVMRAMVQMVKLDIKKLKDAYEQK